MTQTPEGVVYENRLRKLAQAEGLNFGSLDAVMTALGRGGVNFASHDSITDAALADRLHVLASRDRSLTATTTPAGEDARFKEWLGPRAAIFENLKAEQKLALANRFKSEQANPAQSDAAKLTQEMTVRYGSLDAARAQGTATEKLAIERVMPAINPAASVVGPMPPAAMAASAGRRLVLNEGWQRMITLTDKLTTSSGEVRGHHERELNRLVALHPELRPEGNS